MVETAGSPSMTTSQHRCKSLLRPANRRVPIVTVSFGGWHEVAVEEVERLVAVLARQSGQDCDAGRRLWARANLPFCCSGGVLVFTSWKKSAYSSIQYSSKRIFSVKRGGCPPIPLRQGFS